MTALTPENRKETLLAAVIILALMGSMMFHRSGLSGDAVIHLVFAEHALSGHWFEFNVGAASGGESSPLYLLWVMGLYAVSGAKAVPYVLQLGGMGAWLAFLWGVWKFSTQCGAQGPARWIILGGVGLMPGSVRNAVMGMENVYLAAGVMGWLVLQLHWKAWDETPSLRRDFTLAGLGGLLACLRPEGVVIFGVFHSLRLLGGRNPRQWRRFLWTSAVAGALFALQTFWYWRLSHTLPFAGGIARKTLAATQGVELIGFQIHFKLLLRWLAYFPWTGGFIAGCLFLFRATPARISGVIRLGRAMAIAVAVFTLLFMTAFSSHHLGRYTLFYWVLGVMVAWLGAGPWLLQTYRETGLKRMVLVLSLVAWGLVYLVESLARQHLLGKGHSLADVAQAPLHRWERTNSLLRQLEAEDASFEQPVLLGINEVQRRYFWDQRVKVISLDGIVDERLMRFVHEGYYDHLGYAKAVGMTHLGEFPNFNRNKNDFALSNLSSLRSGEVIFRDGVKIQKLSSGYVRLGEGVSPGTHSHPPPSK